MDQSFLEQYIRLEKLCNDIYGKKHGITCYIEDMEFTRSELKNQIHNWNDTYYKLKELRWKRNVYVHEGIVEYNEADIDWLREFYQQIIERKDVLSLRYELVSNGSLQTTGMDRAILTETASGSLVSIILALIVVIVITIIISCFLLV